jgi:hypothetical protein
VRGPADQDRYQPDLDGNRLESLSEADRVDVNRGLFGGPCSVSPIIGFVPRRLGQYPV